MGDPICAVYIELEAPEHYEPPAARDNCPEVQRDGATNINSLSRDWHLGYSVRIVTSRRAVQLAMFFPSTGLA